ncbi:MAG: hypothetical protein JWO46_844 [Nocardioidaceae bacterium]|nr:hypothetical protein [Nocardioidaceae bacterium]
MRAVGWTVLALVFLDELLAMAAAYVWGHHVSGVLLGLVAALVVVVVWFFFASPKAAYGGPVVRPVVKVLVFTLAAVGLFVTGHVLAGALFLGFSAVVNALAQVPSIRDLAHEQA